MLPTHKEGVVYIEHCRIEAADGRLVYARREDALIKHWSIPHAAVTCLLLGPGTSITHQAAKFLGAENVMTGFVGGEGAPLYFASQNEYRPTPWLQEWCRFWFNEQARIEVARLFLYRRTQFVEAAYRKIGLGGPALEDATSDLTEKASKAVRTEELLGLEAVFAKRLYAHVQKVFPDKGSAGFRRVQRGPDKANRFLDQGNYLAYGLAAAALWILGVPHGLPVLHGMTRRGALVFDLADIVKDACILPAAFASAAEDSDESGNRARCMAALDRFKALETMFETIKVACDAGCSRL